LLVKVSIPFPVVAVPDIMCLLSAPVQAEM
jgi:hypothetical protein